jgi:mono/diheme cytochrome c family protein
MSQVLLYYILLQSLGLPKVDLKLLPEKAVRLEVVESAALPTSGWPVTAIPATEVLQIPAFGLSQIPFKYIDSGVRADRLNPSLVRMIGKVHLPAGTHRLLLRGRGASRLIMDGDVVLSTPAPPPSTDGHNPIKTDYLDLGPDFRYAPPGNREKWKTITIQGGEHLIVLETFLGAKLGKSSYRRPELGETVAAISPQGSTSFFLLGGEKPVPYTDEGWQAYASTEAEWCERINAERRAQAFASQKEVWRAKRERDQAWLQKSTEVKIPALSKGYPAQNAIDHFLAQKLSQAVAETTSSDGVDFNKEVRPILEARCYSCHQGAKAKGDLRLDAPSDAIVAGKPDESLLIQRILSADETEQMPPQGDRLKHEEIKTLKRWIASGGSYRTKPTQKLTPLTEDFAFLRRVSLDLIGIIPSESEIQAFEADQSTEKRKRLIDRLLNDPRRAGHAVGYWQDVLAENPNILNPTLNNTGPFRWWLHEAFLDSKPFDVFVTELIQQKGSETLGGPAGFGLASENDVPAAEKAIIVSAAFLGINMKCARCHDAPAHISMQKELFELAGLISGKSIKVPKTSSVPADKFHTNRPSLIKVTLQPGTTVNPAWPFTKMLKDAAAPKQSPRERLAHLLTSAENERFAQVTVNRIWKRLMGRGIVEPVDDWERGSPSHPELLQFLAREFIRSGYDLKQIERLVTNSHAYQRSASTILTEPDPYFAAPYRRRLGAEQVVDSLFAAVGKPMNVGEISLDIDGIREAKNSISLGIPKRAWEFTSTSNERDRPSLALPRVQAVADVLEAFGWRSSRQDATSVRETSPNVLQPAVLANGPMSVWLTRLSDGNELTRLAIRTDSPEAFIKHLYLLILTRHPSAEELANFSEFLNPGFQDRFNQNGVSVKPTRKPPRYVSWSNHLMPEATTIKNELEAAARRGDPPTEQLHADWRQRAEDVIWTIMNSPEFVFSP